MRLEVFVDTAVAAESVEAVQFALDTFREQTPQLALAHPEVTRTELDYLLPQHGKQTDSAVIESVTPWNNRSFDVYLTSRDLGASDARIAYCYGRSRFAGGALIMSAARLDSVDLFGLTLHESGHAVGLVGEDKPQYDATSRFEGHCSNACVMEAVNNPDDMRRVTTTVLAKTTTVGFCDDCADHLHKVRLA